MNDGYDWVAAETLEEARTLLAGHLGCSYTEVEEYLEEPHAMSDEAMDAAEFMDGDPDEPGFDAKTARRLSFRAKLAEMQAAGETFPCYFAGGEG